MADNSTASYNRPQLGVKPQHFYFNVPMFPDVTFSVQTAIVPSVTLGVAPYANPMQDVQLPGEKLTYEPLRMTLMLDEEFRTYTELYGWMREFAFPDNRPDLASKAFTSLSRPPLGDDPLIPMCDCNLIALSSANNPLVTFTFRYAFPIYIGELSFDTTEDGEPFIKFDVEFAYTYFTVDTP